MLNNKKNKIPPPPSKKESNKPSLNTSHETPSILSNVVSGIAIGAGSSIGRNIADSLFSSTTSTQSEDLKKKDELIKSYIECLHKNEYSIINCKDIEKLLL